MKKILALLTATLLLAATMAACATEGTVTTPTASPTASAADSTTSDSNSSKTDTPATDAPAEIGTLEDYVAVAKSATVVYGDGISHDLRLPKILLDSADAQTANTEIMDRFGDDCAGDKNYVGAMDYEAFLNDRILSVYVSAKYDGGNTYGLCYNFDVTTGSLLNNETLCSMTVRDYNAAISALTTNVTTEYDKRYGNIPNNDTEKDKTLASDNITASKMYLDNSGKLKAMVQLYAAVGGGRWVDSFDAE